MKYSHDYDSGFSTPCSFRTHGQSHHQGQHFTFSDEAGVKRTVVQHSAVARNLEPDRKKALVKKLKQFNNNFYKSTGNLNIQTLAHF